MQWEEGTSLLCILLIDTESLKLAFVEFCIYIQRIISIGKFHLDSYQMCYRSTFNTLAVLCACVFRCPDVGRLLFVCEAGELLIINFHRPAQSENSGSI